MTTAAGLDERVKVWDRFVRLAHWALVAAFTVAFLTEDDAMSLHAWAGYVVGGIVVLRVVWGFIGPEHARFSDFLYRPGVVIGYLLALVRLRGRRYLGHSPAGGVMIIVLLAALAGTTGTGIWLYGAADGRGPLASLATSMEPAAPIQGEGREIDGDDDEYDTDDDDRRDTRNGDSHDGRDDNALKEIHELLANLTLLLIILHVGGVLLASFAHRENLPRAMITGTKRR
ncbi:MAG: cytochrome b/b6 domain-containing protein [Proteobacteria bacterium]|nr:cytochrome b/b6 domain-containing protein [Pseudomonadota bacterium]MDA1057844.1 cytochrome b/b6 domain-containing protein [Pseudomonadota bacterium]